MLTNRNDIDKQKMILYENVFWKSEDKPIFKPKDNFDVKIITLKFMQFKNKLNDMSIFFNATGNILFSYLS